MSTCVKIAVATALLAAATAIAVTPPVSRSKDDDAKETMVLPRASGSSQAIMSAKD
jgi:hypothetical protein